MLTIGLFYFGASGSSSELESISQQAQSPDNTAPQGAAPNFSATTLNGESIDLASYQGEKAVVLDFWASWCPNCRRDMPKLNEFYEQYQDEVEVIAINLRESSDVATDYMNSRGFSFPAVLDPDGSIAQQYGVVYTNYHVLIDKDGQIVNTFAGDIAERHFAQLISSDPTT